MSEKEFSFALLPLDLPNFLIIQINNEQAENGQSRRHI